MALVPAWFSDRDTQGEGAQSGRMTRTPPSLGRTSKLCHARCTGSCALLRRRRLLELSRSSCLVPLLHPELNFPMHAFHCPGTDPDHPTLQVLHSDVADMSDKLLPLEPVLPAVSSHPDSALGIREGHGALRPQEAAVWYPAGPQRHSGTLTSEHPHPSSTLRLLPSLHRAQSHRAPGGGGGRSRCTWLVFPRWDGADPGPAPQIHLRLPAPTHTRELATRTHALNHKMLSLSHTHKHTHTYTHTVLTAAAVIVEKLSAAGDLHLSV